MKRTIEPVIVDGVNTNRLFRVVDRGGLRAAGLEPVDESAAKRIEAETAARRLVVVTSGLVEAEVVGVVELTADAPDCAAIRDLYEHHLRATEDFPRTFYEEAFVSWLVERGFAQQLAVAAEWNIDVGSETRDVILDEYPCPRWA